MKNEIVRADFAKMFAASVGAALVIRPFVKTNPRKDGESLIDYTKRLRVIALSTNTN